MKKYFFFSFLVMAILFWSQFYVYFFSTSDHVIFCFYLPWKLSRKERTELPKCIFYSSQFSIFYSILICAFWALWVNCSLFDCQERLEKENTIIFTSSCKPKWGFVLYNLCSISITPLLIYLFVLNVQFFWKNV